MLLELGRFGTALNHTVHITTVRVNTNLEHIDEIHIWREVENCSILKQPPYHIDVTLSRHEDVRQHQVALHYSQFERMFRLAGYAAEFRASLKESYGAYAVVVKDTLDEGAMFLQAERCLIVQSHFVS